MIEQSTLDKIKEVTVVEIAEKLGLNPTKKQGANWVCKCFMHPDNHPSLYLNPAKNVWKCFACKDNNGGGSIALVMKHENLDFYQACQWIAREFSIEFKTVSRYAANNQKPTTMTTTQTTTSTLCTLDSSLIAARESANSHFCQAMINNHILTPVQMQHAVRKYHLGATVSGEVIFWQIDQQQNLRDGKLMTYQPDGHRSRSVNPSWVSYKMKNEWKDKQNNPLLPQEWEKTQCLFGLHLTAGNNQPVALVESEKTAIICSELFYMQGFVWVSCGGISNLSTAMLQPLAGRNIIIFPDTDPDGSTFAKWSSIAQQASKELNQPIHVSNILEVNASPEQKAHKIDIADL